MGFKQLAIPQCISPQPAAAISCAPPSPLFCSHTDSFAWLGMVCRIWQPCSVTSDLKSKRLKWNAFRGCKHKKRHLMNLKLCSEVFFVSFCQSDEKYMWKYTETSIRLHYSCSWQQDWLIDIPLPSLHRRGGVINTQWVRCSRRAPCFLTVMHSNPVSPLRVLATFSSNRTGIKRCCLSTSRINRQLKSLRGSCVLKPVAAVSNKAKIKSHTCAVRWTLGICGAVVTSLNASCVLPTLMLGTGGSCGVQCSGWVILRVWLCIIQHSAWQESVKLTLPSRLPCFRNSARAAAGAI